MSWYETEAIKQALDKGSHAHVVAISDGRLFVNSKEIPELKNRQKCAYCGRMPAGGVHNSEGEFFCDYGCLLDYNDQQASTAKSGKEDGR